ncbi:hypothetical protein AAE478_010403 [Parahypoxylon ruwenzoriense]
MRELSKFTAAAFGRRYALSRPACRGFVTHAPLLQKTQQQPFIPSPEQKKIAESSRTGNVIVSARPGSGKTATAHAIIEANPTACILIIVYNRKLREETAKRLKEYPTCEVYTYHQAAGILYGTLVRDDATLFSLRRSGVVPVWTRQPPNIIIFDELQDCTPNLFWFKCLLIKSITRAAGGQAPRVVGLGDERQAIYDFRGADPRFLSLCPSTIGPLSQYRWASLPLSKSFRLSHETSHFINDTFLGGEKYLTGSHTGPKPIYIHAILENPYELAKKLVPLIRRYGTENTAILAPYIRRNIGLRLLTNLLSEKYRLGVAVSTSDQVTLDNDVIRGKICVSTYHQFKGSERRLVIVYGADETYFKYFGRDLSRNTLPNAVFVACTRATEQLVVLHSARHAPMPCTRLSQFHETAEYVNLARREMKQSSECDDSRQNFPSKVAVSDLARHMPDEILKGIVDEHLHITQVTAASGQQIRAPEKTITNRVKRHFEAVSDLNGIAVVAAYEHKVRHSLVTLGYGRWERPSVPINRNERTVWFCKRACDYEAEVSQYKSRKIQMAGHSFDWLDGDSLESASQRLAEQLNGTGMLLDFEVPLEKKQFRVIGNSGETTKIRLYGFADIVSHDSSKCGRRSQQGEGQRTSIWETKFSAKLSLSDVVQVATYGYLWHVSNSAGNSQELPRMILFNVRTGEKQEVIAKRGITGLVNFIEQLLRAKYAPRGELSDKQFLRNCDDIRQGVQRL